MLVGVLVVMSGCGDDDDSTTKMSDDSTKTVVEKGASDPLPKLGNAKIVPTDRAGRGGAAVAVPVKYDPRRDTDVHHRVDRIEASVVVREKSGQRRELRAKPNSDAASLHPTRLEPQTVEVPLELTPDKAQAVRRALGASGTVEVQSRATVGTGSTDDKAPTDSRILRGSSEVSEVDRPEGAPLKGNLGQDRSGNACAYGTVRYPCENISGGKWTANHYLESHTWKISCPPNTYPAYQIPLIMGGDPSWSIKTTAKYFTDGSSFLTNAQLVTVTDHNYTGHPHVYEGFTACCEEPATAKETCGEY
jgi:hypothetical protein